MIEMSQWMTEVMSLLQCRLDADILAGDLPNEYEVRIFYFGKSDNIISFVIDLCHMLCSTCIWFKLQFYFIQARCIDLIMT